MSEEEEEYPLTYKIVKEALKLDITGNRRLYQAYFDRNKDLFDKMRKHQEELGMPTYDEYVGGLITELMVPDVDITELANGTKIITKLTPQHLSIVGLDVIPSGDMNAMGIQEWSKGERLVFWFKVLWEKCFKRKKR